MACPDHGPCSWPDLDLGCLRANESGLPEAVDPCLDNGLGVDQAVIDSSVTASKELLWALTGRQFGECCVTLRPCRKSCNPCPDVPGFQFGVGPNGYGPAQIGGLWYNVSCNTCSECSCTEISEVPLPYPACCIENVKIDGIELDPDMYRIDDFRHLVRLDGERWPLCQDLTKEDTEEGTWSISVCYGRPVPELVLLAAAEMACQLIKLGSGQPCQLPQRMSSLTRQGVSVAFLDPQEFWRDRRTGIYLVDLAVNTYNPSHLTRRPSVWSPDMGSWRVTTAAPGEECP